MELLSSDLEKWIFEMWKKDLYSLGLGMEISCLSRGNAVIHMKIIEEKHSNMHGTAHGGSLVSALDSAMALACLTLGKRCVTLNMYMQWLRPVEIGQMAVINATAILNGARNILTEANITDQDGNILAKASATFAVFAKLNL